MPRTPLGTEPGLRRRILLEANRLLREEVLRFGDEIRNLRLRRGLTQADVARAAGVSRSVVSRIESGWSGASLRIRFRVAVLLGARLRLPVYPDGTPLLMDGVHARIVERLLALRARRWRPTLEAPVPGPGRRSSDLRLDHANDVVLFEVESHVRRWEEIVRECQSKRDAVRSTLAPSKRVHVVLVLPPTAHQRALVAAHPENVAAIFPVRSGALRAALSSGDGAWPGDGLLWIGRGGSAAALGAGAAETTERG